jgi:hypothetical protein
MSSAQVPNDGTYSSDSTQDGAAETKSPAQPSSSSTESTSPPTGFSPISQRFTYAPAVSKDQQLLNLTLDPTTPHSEFTSAAQLKDWGYTTTPQTVFPLNHKDTWALLKPILPNNVIDAKIITSVHITPTAHNNIPSPETNAWFVNTIDLNNGILVAGSNHEPVFTTRYRKLGEGERFPELMHWSDIAYLQALSLSHVNAIGHHVPSDTVLPRLNAIKALKYVVRYGIENVDTNIVIHDIIQKHVGEKCEYDTADQGFDTGCPHGCEKIPWPGIVFKMGSEEALALLGTPNECGVAWLLAQHGEFAGKRISRVRLW